MAYLKLDKNIIKSTLQSNLMEKPLRSIPNHSVRKSKPQQSFHSFISTLYSLKEKLKKIKRNQSTLLSVPSSWYFSFYLSFSEIAKVANVL